MVCCFWFHGSSATGPGLQGSLKTGKPHLGKFLGNFLNDANRCVGNPHKWHCLLKKGGFYIVCNHFVQNLMHAFAYNIHAKNLLSHDQTHQPFWRAYTPLPNAAKENRFNYNHQN